LTGPIVIAGASGFVGRHLVDRLRQAGREVLCGTRDPARAAAIRPGFRWTALDVDDPATLDRALVGADALVFLVHRMRETGHLADTERASAERVVAAAERAGVRRIVYLGGPTPTGDGSEHLAARVGTGEVLRSGRVSTIELRAGMIIGAGSESWLIVRDLALRLPVMLLPRWLRSRSQPVWVGDVVEALATAIDDPLNTSEWFDLPGPEALSGKEILLRIAARVGLRPVMLSVPVLTPGLSSHWIRLVTRADITIARRLVEGLGADLVAPGDGYWARMPAFTRTPLDAAIDAALAAEASLTGVGAAWERAARRVGRQVG
jgi:uncharacterized protein YbjT (DUF2867 family)